MSDLLLSIHSDLLITEPRDGSTEPHAKRATASLSPEDVALPVSFSAALERVSKKLASYGIEEQHDNILSDPNLCSFTAQDLTILGSVPDLRSLVGVQDNADANLVGAESAPNHPPAGEQTSHVVAHTKPGLDHDDLASHSPQTPVVDAHIRTCEDSARSAPSVLASQGEVILRVPDLLPVQPELLDRETQSARGGELRSVISSNTTPLVRLQLDFGNNLFDPSPDDSHSIANNPTSLSDRGEIALRAILLKSVDILTAAAKGIPTFTNNGQELSSQQAPFGNGKTYDAPMVAATVGDGEVVRTIEFERFHLLDVQIHGGGNDSSKLSMQVDAEPETNVRHIEVDIESPSEPSGDFDFSAPHPYDSVRAKDVGFLRLVESQGLRPFASGLERIDRLEQFRESSAQIRVSRISLQMPELGTDARLQIGLVGKTIHAQIVVPDADIRNNLVAQLEQLKTHLEHRGYDVGQIRILSSSSDNASASIGRHDLYDEPSWDGSGAHERMPGDREDGSFHQRRRQPYDYAVFASLFYENDL